jgi:SAM-dependent methyltransferase
MPMGPARFALASELYAQFVKTVEQLATSPTVRSVCEIGGGANPLLPIEFVRSRGIEYTVVDISAEELAKAPNGYRKVQADVAAADPDIAGRYDLVFSQWLAEHVRSGRTFHQNVANLLTPGGYAVHVFPTLYSPPFVLNWLTPDWISESLLLWLQPHRHREGRHGKFPAYYRWCTGPSRRQLARLASVGFEVVEYHGFFGHSGAAAVGDSYLDRLPRLMRYHERLASWLVGHPIPALTSYACVVLHKPALVARDGDAPEPDREGIRHAEALATVE